MRMIFVFIDGLGLGVEDKFINPVYAANAPTIQNILGSRAIPTDTSLGVKGLPQSATGQTTIFTGVNAPQVLGRHLSGQPTLTLKKIIIRNNLFKELIRMGFTVTSSNVYREEYLKKMLNPKERRYRPSVTTVMGLSVRLKFRNVQDYIDANGVYHDITGQIIKDSGYSVPLITPQEAAERLYRISRYNDFTLFEHFMTDIIGHKKDMELAVKEIELLDEFLRELIKLVDPEEDILFITSDHGNIEDISVNTHTMNKVPTVILGKLPKKSDIKIGSLVDIMPAVLSIFKTQGSKERK
jgi:2,3-bisphosphoglycerate-independent phosphoglycerate mutase